MMSCPPQSVHRAGSSTEQLRPGMHANCFQCFSSNDSCFLLGTNTRGCVQMVFRTQCCKQPQRKAGQPAQRRPPLGEVFAHCTWLVWQYFKYELEARFWCCIVSFPRFMDYICSHSLFFCLFISFRKPVFSLTGLLPSLPPLLSLLSLLSNQCPCVLASFWPSSLPNILISNILTP